MSPHCERDRDTGMEHKAWATALSVSQKFILLVSVDKGRTLGRGRETSLLLSPPSVSEIHQADTPTSPGVRESEMTQRPDALLSRESADAETGGRENLEFCCSVPREQAQARREQGTMGCTQLGFYCCVSGFVGHSPTFQLPNNSYDRKRNSPMRESPG